MSVICLPWLILSWIYLGLSVLDEAQIRDVESRTAHRLEAKGVPANQVQVGIVCQDQYICSLHDATRFSDGTMGTYGRLVDPDDTVPGVIILPVYREQVLLIRHFQHATRTSYLEIPRDFGLS